MADHSAMFQAAAIIPAERSTKLAEKHCFCFGDVKRLAWPVVVQGLEDDRSSLRGPEKREGTSMCCCLSRSVFGRERFNVL